MYSVSNFDFLKDYDDTLWKLGNRIEKQVNISPSGVKADATTFLEHILKKLLTKAGLKYNSRKPFTDQIDAVFRSDINMSNAYRERIKNAYNYRNKIHDDFDDIEKHEFQDALQLHEKLFYIARKFYRDYSDDYDEYKGVPDYRPLVIDYSEDEVKIRDFNEIIDVKYDYCVVCGKPNHLNYSIYCHECSSMMDNANNFISVRNSFGKDAKFTKEDLIEFGMSEGYVNSFLSSMVRQNMLKVAGRFITFNNMYMDDYLAKIDNYIAVGELITRFCEDKISPSEIRKSREYILGSRNDEYFYQFYKLVNTEIVKKFEKDILSTRDYEKSISYTTITDDELKRWYDIRLAQHRKSEFNESFILYNELLIEDYLDLKRQSISDDEISDILNVSDETYEFWHELNDNLKEEVREIKMDLICRAITEGKTKNEIIEYAGVTVKEYDDLIKISEFKDNEFHRMRNREIESRKSNFLKFLKNHELENSCKLAKFTLEDFYRYYDDADEDSEFFKLSTRLLMKKYLTQRKLGKTKKDAIESVKIPEKYFNRWQSQSKYSQFKDMDLQVTVDLILKGFKHHKPIDEISKTACVNENTIKSYISLGERGSKIYRPLFEYYESNIFLKN